MVRKSVKEGSRYQSGQNKPARRIINLCTHEAHFFSQPSWPLGLARSLSRIHKTRRHARRYRKISWNWQHRTKTSRPPICGPRTTATGTCTRVRLKQRDCRSGRSRETRFASNGPSKRSLGMPATGLSLPSAWEGSITYHRPSGAHMAGYFNG